MQSKTAHGQPTALGRPADAHACVRGLGAKAATQPRSCARTMHMEPPTASPMPANFCAEPASRCSSTAIMAVNTGMVGCMQVATTTPDRSMPMM